jgi:hypothetical protein
MAPALDGLRESVVDAFGAVAAAAGSHSYGNTRNRGNEFGHPRLPHCVEGSKIQNSRHALLSRSDGFDFALNSALRGVTADAVVHFDDRRHGALPEAGDSAHGKLAIGSGEQEFVGLIAIGLATVKAEP